MGVVLRAATGRRRPHQIWRACGRCYAARESTAAAEIQSRGSRQWEAMRLDHVMWIEPMHGYGLSQAISNVSLSHLFRLTATASFRARHRQTFAPPFGHRWVDPAGCSQCWPKISCPGLGLVSPPPPLIRHTLLPWVILSYSPCLPIDRDLLFWIFVTLFWLRWLRCDSRDHMPSEIFPSSSSPHDESSVNGRKQQIQSIQSTQAPVQQRTTQTQRQAAHQNH